MMTHLENLAKQQVLEKLAQEGHNTYARLFDHFHLNLTNDPECIAYMIPGKRVIVVNAGLDIDQVSTVVRHEILHEFLTHQERLLKHLGVDQDQVSGDVHELANIAADYEISNKGYTDHDKLVIRKLLVGGQVLRGLVTEDDHPDWVDLSFEEMFDKLMEEHKNDRVGDLGDDPQYSDEFIEGWKKAIEDYNNGVLKL